MSCPACGGSAGVIVMTVGLVRVSTFHCVECKKGWRECVLTVEFSANVAEQEIKRLRAMQSTTAIHAIRYLESRLTATSVKTLEQKRLDAWERKFLRASIGDDYG